jgi:hypothetical protein
MAKIEIVRLEDARNIEPAAKARGQVHSRAYFDKTSDPLRLSIHQLSAGATLNLAAAPTDALAYVWKGVVLVRGVRLEQRSSFIIDRGGSAEIAAATEATVLLFGLDAQAGAAGVTPSIHLLPNERVPRSRDLDGQGSAGGALHADASRPDARLWLHENDFYLGDFQVAPHSHSEDEIIFVREGELRLGERLYGPGTALAIAANARYGFHAGPNGLSFVNFRGGPPTCTSHDGQHTMDEAEFWRSETGRPEYLTVPCG